MTNDLSDSRPSWRPSTQAIGASDLPGALGLHGVVAVHFWAEWNTVDQALSPVMVKLAAEFVGRLAVRSMDVDDPRLVPFMRERGVVQVPTVMCFVDGVEFDRLVGLSSEADFGRFLKDGLRCEKVKQSWW